jgi:uncharacterized protein (DUF885 family)
MGSWLGLVLAAVLFQTPATAGTKADAAFDALAAAFLPAYEALHVPELEYGYEDNFKNIQSLDGIARQKKTIGRFLSALRKLPRRQLSDKRRPHYDALAFQLALDLERLGLEKRFRESGLSVPAGGLARVPNHHAWYRYFVRKWTAASHTPEALYRFGLAEVSRARGEMALLQKRLGFEGKDEAFYRHLNGESFWIKDGVALEKRFSDFRASIRANLSRLFPDWAVPEVGIQAVPSPTKDTPPGYYTKDVFYYSFYGGRFPGRSLEWLFLHEAIPGHHYQHHTATAPFSTTKLFSYPGFSEGWGAYVEDLGWELGAYGDPYQAYGKWEWDLVRSIRVPLDVGINYYGWTKAQALAFWRAHVANQEGIAEREVDRLFRWPAQVLAYKVGERELLRLRQLAKRAGATDRDFHRLVLEHGELPLPVVRAIVLDEST